MGGSQTKTGITLNFANIEIKKHNALRLKGVCYV